jgi:hypothetical protein
MNHPQVECRNNNLNYLFTLNLKASYKDILQRRLAILEAWASNHSLESATELINNSMNGYRAKPKEVQKAIFGTRGMITSIRNSLSRQGNSYNPYRQVKLVRKEGTPFLEEVGTNQLWIRGEVIKGQAPQKKVSNVLTAIRQCVESNLNLPLYIRHKIVEHDETVCRDANGNPV